MWDSFKVNSVMTLEADQLTGHRSAGSLTTALSHSTTKWGALGTTKEGKKQEWNNLNQNLVPVTPAVCSVAVAIYATGSHMKTSQVLRVASSKMESKNWTTNSHSFECVDVQ